MTINELVDTKLLQKYHNQEKRNYLGASGLGDECARRIQYQYWHKVPTIKAISVRTFDIGHKLEDLVAQWLIDSGFDILTKNSHNEQFSFSTANGKIEGHVDGILRSCTPDIKEALGISESDNKPFPWLWENKTMNNKNWNDTSKRGVRMAKPIYFVQVQLYMAYMNLGTCLFTALNKDSYKLYFEQILFDSETAQKYSDRAVDILKACENNELFPRIALDKNFFKCKMCGFYSECWKN